MKYTAEEVRETERILRKHSNGPGTFDYEASDMLTAYANRIEADERLVPRFMTAQDEDMGGWLAASLDDPAVCTEMKLCVSRWMDQFTHPPAQAAQLWEMKQLACRAHALCNELRLAHPEIPELGDDGVLHEAIHDILRVDTPTAAPEQAAQVEAAAIDTIALRAAEEIALMWGQDRSQFVAKIQVRIISALQQMRDAPLFGDASALAEWLESLHECNADGAVGGRKWEPAQIAAKAVREAARLTQPAQSVDVAKVREVIADLREYGDEGGRPA